FRRPREFLPRRHLRQRVKEIPNLCLEAAACLAHQHLLCTSKSDADLLPNWHVRLGAKVHVTHEDLPRRRQAAVPSASGSSVLDQTSTEGSLADEHCRHLIPHSERLLLSSQRPDTSLVAQTTGATDRALHRWWYCGF